MNEFKENEFYRLKPNAEKKCPNIKTVYNNNNGKIWIKITSMRADGTSMSYDAYPEDKKTRESNCSSCLDTNNLINNEPTGSLTTNIMNGLSLMMKKLLNPDLQTLVKAAS